MIVVFMSLAGFYFISYLHVVDYLNKITLLDHREEAILYALARWQNLETSVPVVVYMTYLVDCYYAK